MTDWLANHWQPVIAVWGAAVSSVLAVRTWWRERSRVHFSVDVGKAGIDGRGNLLLVRGALAGGRTLEGGVAAAVIGVYNRSRDPLHLHQVGLRLTDGTARMVFFQSPGFQELPVKLEPTDRFTMVSKVKSVVQGLPEGAVPAKHIRGPFCKDGAGQEYGRHLRRDERQALTNALEAAAK